MPCSGRQPRQPSPRLSPGRHRVDGEGCATGAPLLSGKVGGSSSAGFLVWSRQNEVLVAEEAVHNPAQGPNEEGGVAGQEPEIVEGRPVAVVVGLPREETVSHEEDEGDGEDRKDGEVDVEDVTSPRRAVDAVGVLQDHCSGQEEGQLDRAGFACLVPAVRVRFLHARKPASTATPTLSRTTTPIGAPRAGLDATPIWRARLAGALAVDPRRLDVIAQTVRSCTRCPLHAGRINAVPGEGTGSAGILLVGEAPGRNEDETGRPFCGAAGKNLDLALREAGIDRASVFVTSIVKCRPPENRDPTPMEKAACRPHLEAQVAALTPRVIVALGRHGLAGLLGEVPKEFANLRGTFLAGPGGIPIFVSLHPAAVIYRQKWKEQYLQDWRDFGAWLRGAGPPGWPPAPGSLGGRPWSPSPTSPEA